MNHNDQYKVIGHVSPAGLAHGASVSVSSVIDTFGYSGGRLIITVNLGDLSSPALSCFVKESDDDSNYFTLISTTDTDVDGVAGVEVAASDDDRDVVFDIPLIVPRKRYFQISYRSGSGGFGKSTVSVHAIIIGKSLGVAQSTATLTQRTGSKAYRVPNS